jgi:hypothetical protein
MAAEAEKVTRPGFLWDVCISKYQVPNLSDSNHIFRA